MTRFAPKLVPFGTHDLSPKHRGQAQYCSATRKEMRTERLVVKFYDELKKRETDIQPAGSSDSH